MTRFSERVRIARVRRSRRWVALVSCVALSSLASLTGCEQLDGRNRVKKGNRLFRETQFIDAAAEYQQALTKVDDPAIHYNLGLAYSKVFKPGFEGPVLLGVQGEFVCDAIPGAKIVQAGACVKEGDRHYAECGTAKSAPIEKDIADLKDQLKSATDDQKKKDLKSQITDKEQDLAHITCSSSFHCVEGAFCSLTSPQLADLAAQHLQTWIKAQPSDEEIKKQLDEASARLDEAKKADNKSKISDAQREVDDLQTKDQTRKQMTLLWADSEQYPKAIEYWSGLLQEKPNDTGILATIAGIYLKAGDWRKSIEFYNKAADQTKEGNEKVALYNFIGNVGWSKLNSRLLVGNDAIELADRSIAALQRAAEIQPKNPRLVGLEASIFNFRSTTHGASFAAAIDRATAQDLLKLSRVLADEAKKAQGLTPGAPPTSPAPASPNQAGSGAGSGSSAAPSGSAAPAGSASGSAAPAAAAPAPGSGPASPASAAPPAAAAPASGSSAPSNKPAEAPAAPPAAPAAGGSAQSNG